jgi:chemotaxis signal transduction protein
VRPQRTAAHKGAREDVILFTVGEFKFAIAANAVSEIRSMDGLRHFFTGSGYNRMSKVEFTLERNRATYFVVNAARHFRLGTSKPSRVLILRQGSAAVLVDSTDRMTEISVLHALPQAFSGEERNWYRGLAVVNGDVVPVVNQAAFLSKGETLVLKELLEQSRTAVAAI